MIDLNLYRFRIGVFNQRSKVRHGKTAKESGNCIPNLGFSNYKLSILYVIYIYFILGVMSVTMAMTLDVGGFPVLGSSPLLSNTEFIHTHLTNVKLLFVILISFLIKRICQRGCLDIYLSYMLQRECPVNKRVSASLQLSRVSRMLAGFCCWIFCLNFIMITLINPSLLNPGPGCSPRVVFHNVQGLIPFSQLGSKNPTLDTTKVLELNTYLSVRNPDILILNETWLKKSISDSEIISTDKYKIFRLDRSHESHPPDPNFPNKFRRNGGGVLVAINRDLDIISTKIGIKCNAEILGITLKFSDGKKVALCTCYRVGTLGQQNHDDVHQYIQSVLSRRGINNMILIGDLNLPHVQWDNFHSNIDVEQSFLDTFSNFGLEQLVNSSTHVKGNLLDLLLTNKPQILSDISVSNDYLVCKSDHFPISFKLKSKIKRMKPTKRQLYNFKRADWDSINSELHNVNWDQLLLSNDDIEFAWSRFRNKLFEVLDKFIPKIKVNCGSQPPWFDSEAHDLCREKERLRSRYKQTKLPEHYVKYSDCRRKFKHLVQQKMRDNIMNDDEDSNLITKKFWSFVKSSSNSQRIPELIHHDDVYRSDPSQQAELFNNYFYSQFSHESTYHISIEHQRHNVTPDIDLSSRRIKNILTKLNVNKAIGPDGIHGRVLKNCAEVLCYPLSILFKLSYYTSTIPLEWKMAHVVPIHKKGSKTNVENYRPISLTSIIMKTLERIIRDELMFQCNHFIDSRQHGFLPGKSCCTQLVSFCDSLSLSLNKNVRSDVIYFDFAKAFDSVNHDLILNKLKSFFNINGFLLGFLRNYLKDRKQSVIIGNCTSQALPVLSGVPQGSIIGPSLFVLFLNDISSGLSPDTNICMYADDTKIWRVVESETDHAILQKDIDYLLDWAIKNKMKFHSSKCKVLMVSNSSPPLIGILPQIQYYYTMDSEILDYCDTEKDLGIHMNSNLNFTHHANMLYSKANQRLGLLKRTCHSVNNTCVKRALYLTLVRSLFEHCPIIWRPSSNSAIAKLESIQKRAFKWILNDTYISYSLNHLYYVHCKQLNILPIKYRFDYHDLKFFHTVVNGFTCVNLPDYLQPFSNTRLRSSHLDSKCYVSSVLPRNLLSNQNFESNSQRNFNNSYFYRAHLLWNKLPLSAREIVSTKEFETFLLKYIWEECIAIERGQSMDEFEYDSND